MGYASSWLQSLKSWSLRKSRGGSLGDQYDPLADHVVTTDEALHVLRGERPLGEENRIAVAILEAVARMGRGRLSDTADGVRELDAALSSLATVRSNAKAAATAFPIEELRAPLASQLAPAQAPAFDVNALREMISSVVRESVVQVETERWSGMLRSEAIAKFETEEVCNRGGAKHQEDVPRRLASFLRAVGDKPIRDVSRDDLRAYRDLLDQAPDRFTLRFKTNDLHEAIAANLRLKTG